MVCLEIVEECHEEAAALLKYYEIKFVTYKWLAIVWDLSDSWDLPLTGEFNRLVNREAIPLLIAHVLARLDTEIHYWESIFISYREMQSFSPDVIHADWGKSWQRWGLWLKTSQSWLSSGLCITVVGRVFPGCVLLNPALIQEKKKSFKQLFTTRQWFCSLGQGSVYSCPDLSFRLVRCYLSRGILCHDFFNLWPGVGWSLSQPAEHPKPSQFSHLSFSIFWWLLNLRAHIPICCGIHLLPAWHPVVLSGSWRNGLSCGKTSQPTLMVSSKKNSAKARSDLVSQAGCSN